MKLKEKLDKTEREKEDAKERLGKASEKLRNLTRKLNGKIPGAESFFPFEMENPLS